jgi:hypothetical protein
VAMMRSFLSLSRIANGLYQAAYDRAFTRLLEPQAVT